MFRWNKDIVVRLINISKQKVSNCIVKHSKKTCSTKRLYQCNFFFILFLLSLRHFLSSHLILHTYITQFHLPFFSFLFYFQQNKISCWAMLLLVEVFMVTIIILFINMVYCLFRYIVVRIYTTYSGISRFRILHIKMAMRQQEKSTVEKKTHTVSI